ncbi:MAG: protein phosphatase 2C domain-containing protein [Deltaproteobacteria bacterium]|nr:protein phosphatase 2C domain-containing protein [Deltaproteobacteria bacterium]
MRFTVVGQTDVGQKRENNEDSYLIRQDLNLFVVADGMGGHAGGECASKLAVETIAQIVEKARGNGVDPLTEVASMEEARLADTLREAVEAACYAIFHKAKAEPHLAGMGTTVSSMVLKPSSREGVVDAFFGHVGDSRIYLVRGELIQQVSEDHSLVAEQIRAGVLTEEEAKVSRFKNIITRSVGFEEDVLVDVMGLWAEPGDVFVLCSDGLANYLDQAEYFQLVREHPAEKIAALPQAFIDVANARGGDDNITVIVVRVEES